MKSRMFLAAFVLLMLVIALTPSTATTTQWDLWSDFRGPATSGTGLTQSGTWLYGYGYGSSFTAYDAYDAGNKIWYASNSLLKQYPEAENKMGVSNSMVTVVPGMVNDMMQVATARWVAPTEMDILIHASFSPYYHDTSANAAVYHGTFELVSGSVAGLNSLMYSSASPLHVDSEQYIDFSVGDGGNGMDWDRVYVAAQVSAVPEPGTILAAMSILAPAGMFFRRKHK